MADKRTDAGAVATAGRARGAVATAPGPARARKGLGAIELRLPRLRAGVKTKNLVVFTRQLSTMVDAGLPLVQSLDILAAQEPDRHFQKVIYGVKASVEAGTTLAGAMKRYPKVFDDLYTSMVAAGELGGVLDAILQRLAIYLEKSMKLRQKVKSAMRYPMVVFSIAIGIFVLMMFKVVPSFAAIFKSVGHRQLPALTRVVVNMSKNFVSYLPFIVIAGVLVVVGFVAMRKTRWGRKFFDRLFLGVPVIGDLLRKSSIARTCRTLGTLVASGVPVLDAMDIAAKGAGNTVIEDALRYTGARVAEGKNIAGPLEETRIFPKMVAQMFAVGESTGAMDVMLGKVADFYEEEVDASVEGLTSMIEPIIIVVIAVMVGFILVAMYLPIFQLAENLSRR